LDYLGPLHAGQTEDAALLHGNWTAAWKTFGWLPELFDAGVTQRHPLQRVRYCEIVQLIILSKYDAALLSMQGMMWTDMQE
jgi:hypothetical protein